MLLVRMVVLTSETGGFGQGVDYDGSASTRTSSTNYSLQIYANDVVAALQDICIRNPSIRPPIILSESGRALSSFHSILLFDVLGCSSPRQEIELASKRVAAKTDGETAGLHEHSLSRPGPYLLKTFAEVLSSMNEENYQECYNDALQFMGKSTR